MSTDEATISVKPRYPNDEFETMRARSETYPTLAAYLATRSQDELGALIWNDIYRKNIFGTYRGTSGEQALDILAAAANLSRNNVDPDRLLKDALFAQHRAGRKSAQYGGVLVDDAGGMGWITYEVRHDGVSPRDAAK